MTRDEIGERLKQAFLTASSPSTAYDTRPDTINECRDEFAAFQRAFQDALEVVCKVIDAKADTELHQDAYWRVCDALGDIDYELQGAYEAACETPFGDDEAYDLRREAEAGDEMEGR